MESTTCTQRGMAGLLVAVLMSHAALAGTIMYVDPQAPGDNDGSSWTHAYTILLNAMGRA